MVILDGEDVSKCEEQLWKLEVAMEDFNQTQDEFQLAVSGGYACSSELETLDIKRTYLKADEEMYRNKKRKKELEELHS